MSALFRVNPGVVPDRLVDVHLDVNPAGGDAAVDGVPGALDGTGAVRALDTAGIARACASPPPQPSYDAANDALLRWAADSAGRVVAFARLAGRRRRVRPRGRAPLAPDRLERFAGVKLVPHLDGPPSEEQLEHIAERRLTVLVHGGVRTPVAWIERALVRRLPGPVIVAHLGSFPGGEPELLAAVDLARRHERVLLDTSGEWVSEFLRHAARAVPGKVVFGSAAPLAHPLVAWQHVASAVRDDAALARIAHRNAEEALGL